MCPEPLSLPQQSLKGNSRNILSVFKLPALYKTQPNPVLTGNIGVRHTRHGCQICLPWVGERGLTCIFDAQCCQQGNPGWGDGKNQPKAGKIQGGPCWEQWDDI